MLSFLHSVLRSQRDFASTVLRFKSYKTPSFHSPNCPAPPYHMQRCLTHIPLSLALPYMPLFDLKKSTQMQHTSTIVTKNHQKIIELTSLSSKENKYTHKSFSFSTISFISNITISGNLFSCIYL